MDDYPLVSVIIPAYNAANYIRQTIESVLAQTYFNIEVLVVDDGSTDATPEIVNQFATQDSRIVLLKQTNAGVAAARNLAISQSRGEFIAPLDADDIWYPQKLEKQVNCFIQSDHTVGLVYAWSIFIDEEGQQMSYCQSDLVEGDVLVRLIFKNSPGNSSSPLIRHSCLRVVGNYDCCYRDLNAQGCEDWDLYLRIAERYEFRVVPECLVGYRQVIGSMSFDHASMVKSYEIIIAGLEQRHPNIPPKFYRWSTAHFYWYIALKCRGGKDYISTLRYLYHTMWLDSLYLLNISLYYIVISSLMSVFLKPIIKSPWQGNKHLKKLSKHTSPPFQIIGLKPLQNCRRQFPRNYFNWLLNRRLTYIEKRIRGKAEIPPRIQVLDE
jgi:glycosyltransferase involved in cell wall biosynthesis